MLRALTSAPAREGGGGLEGALQPPLAGSGNLVALDHRDPLARIPLVTWIQKLRGRSSASTAPTVRTPSQMTSASRRPGR